MIVAIENVRHASELSGVFFELEYQGKKYSVLISDEALEENFGPCDTPKEKIRFVRKSIALARKVIERINAGETSPILLTTSMFR